MEDRYEVWLHGRFWHSFPTRDAARKAAKRMGGVVKDLGGK